MRRRQQRRRRQYRSPIFPGIAGGDNVVVGGRGRCDGARAGAGAVWRDGGARGVVGGAGDGDDDPVVLVADQRALHASE